MKNRIKQLLVGLLSAGMLMLPVSAAAQPDVTSSPTNVTLNMTVAESISVSTNINSLTFTYNPSTNSATTTTPIVITTQYNIGPSHSFLSVDAFLSSTTSALTGSNGGSIPAADVFAATNSGPAIPCNGTVWGGTGVGGNLPGTACGPAGVGGSSIHVIMNPPAASATLTDSVSLSLGGLPTLVPGQYTGILTIIGEAD